VRGAGKRVMSLLLPLNMLEADITESSKSTLYTARNLTSSHSLLGIRNNIYKNTMTMFLSEVIYRTMKDGTHEQGLFEWCRTQILLLDAMQSDFSNFHIRFLLELSVALGFSPETSDLMPFVGENHMTVSQFMTTSFAESMLIPLSGTIRNKICEDVLRYIEYHTESTLTINSLKVLRELFI
jgi:DNA repair protein RecO (recombination protein O)